jgi:hypothetical protein
MLALLFALGSLLGQQAPVQGTAVDEFTGLPLEGVAVSFHGEMTDQGHYSGKTTAEGKFSFDGVKPGRYSLKVELEGYQFPRVRAATFWLEQTA